MISLSCKVTSNHDMTNQLWHVMTNQLRHGQPILTLPIMAWPTNYDIAIGQPIMTWPTNYNITNYDMTNQLWHGHWSTKHFTIHWFTIEKSGNGDYTATSLNTSPGVGLPLVEKSIPHVRTICLNTSLILINNLKISLCAIGRMGFLYERGQKGQVQSANPLKANILSNMKQMHLRVNR